MHLPYSKNGAASVATVLAAMEDIFQKKGVHDKESMLATSKQADFLLYANFVAENATILANAGAENYRQPCGHMSMKINKMAKKRFISILSRVTKAQEGISRQERFFVYRFWSQIQNSLLRRL